MNSNPLFASGGNPLFNKIDKPKMAMPEKSNAAKRKEAKAAAANKCGAPGLFTKNRNGGSAGGGNKCNKCKISAVLYCKWRQLDKHLRCPGR